MQALILAAAEQVAASPFGRCCSQIGAALDYIIPIILFFAVIAGLTVVAFGLVQ